MALKEKNGKKSSRINNNTGGKRDSKTGKRRYMDKPARVKKSRKFASFKQERDYHRLPERYKKAFDTAREWFGDQTKDLSNAVLNPRPGTSSKKVLSDLYESFEGDSWKRSEIFVENVILSTNQILRKFPIMDKIEAKPD